MLGFPYVSWRLTKYELPFLTTTEVSYGQGVHVSQLDSHTVENFVKVNPPKP